MIYEILKEKEHIQQIHKAFWRTCLYICKVHNASSRLTLFFYFLHASLIMIIMLCAPYCASFFQHQTYCTICGLWTVIDIYFKQILTIIKFSFGSLLFSNFEFKSFEMRMSTEYLIFINILDINQLILE